MAEDDARDERPAGSVPERLRGLLDVEPLDELTRRRLVTTAVRASAPPSRSRRWVAAAAAVVALAVGGGVALLATGGGDTSAPTALSDAENKSATPNATPPNVTLESSASEAATSAADAGDFGDLSEATNLARVRSSLGADSTLRGTGQAADAAAPSGGASATNRLAAFPCADELPEGTVVAIGTARVGAREAVVVAIDQPDGTRTIAAVVAQPCEVRPLE